MNDITVVTGTRAEYGILRKLMRKFTRESDFTLSVVATGMHLSVKHGHTIDDIYEDGFGNVRTVEMLIDSDSGVGMAKSLGIGTAGLAECLDDIDPDIIIVLGDRGEALAAGMAAAHLGIPVGHIHGGDSMNGATIDDSIRHALTKFSHVHFPASECSAERIQRLGEEEWRITPVGALGLDEILDEEYTAAQGVRERYEIDPDRDLLLIVQHPLTVGTDDAADQLRATLDAVDSVDAHKLLVYPNADLGGKQQSTEEWDDLDNCG